MNTNTLIKIIELLGGIDPMVLVTLVCLFALYVVLSCVHRLAPPKKSGK
jgi:hypothetical protein